MPFFGETFKRLGLPPYAGALARELQNLADGLTTVNAKVGGGFTLHQGAAPPLGAEGKDGDWHLNTSDGSWYDKVSGVWVIRYTDQLGAAGTTDGVASGISFAQAGNTVTATVARTQNLDALTGTFDVFSGAYNDLTGLPTIPAATPANRLLPSGGTAAQVLTKVDAGDYEVNWTTLPTGGGGGSGDDAFPWATEGNTDRIPYDKHGLDVVIGITSVTYDTSTRNLRVRLPQTDGGDTFQEVVLPEWLTAAGIADWAEDGDNSNVPNSKLPGNLVTAIDSFTYDVPSHTIQLQLTRLSGGPVAGTVTIPEFLAESAVETWALIANSNQVIPSAKLPAHTVGLLPAFDPGSNLFSIARTTSAGSTVTTSTTFPAWAEEADLFDWAFTGNTDRLPYSKIPIHLRSLGTFGFDANTRQITFNFNDTTPTLQTRTITLPNYLTAADVTSFDIHDGVADTAPVQDPGQVHLQQRKCGWRSHAVHPGGWPR